MLPLISPGAMRGMEQRYFAETGTPSIQLMERAARALCDAILRRYGPGLKVAFACGPGGNGGDGYACARMYAESGGDCALLSSEPPRSPDAAENLRRARAAGIRETKIEELPGPPDVWVDALYGTGLSRAPEGVAAALIGRMNADRARGSAVVAVDIPSGLDGATGAAWTPCVTADATFTFQFAKTGHWLADGLDACGDVEVLDIGIPSPFFPGGMAALMEAEDVRAAVDRLREAGYPIDAEPRQGSDLNWQAWTRDPDGIRIELAYEFFDRTSGKVCATATSKHCFVKDGRVASLKRELPELDAKFAALLPA